MTAGLPGTSQAAAWCLAEVPSREADNQTSILCPAHQRRKRNSSSPRGLGYLGLRCCSAPCPAARQSLVTTSTRPAQGVRGKREGRYCPKTRRSDLTSPCWLAAILASGGLPRWLCGALSGLVGRALLVKDCAGVNVGGVLCHYLLVVCILLLCTLSVLCGVLHVLQLVRPAFPLRLARLAARTGVTNHGMPGTLEQPR